MSFFEIISRKHELIHPLGLELNLKLNLPEEAWVSQRRLLLLSTSRDACVDIPRCLCRPRRSQLLWIACGNSISPQRASQHWSELEWRALTELKWKTLILTYSMSQISNSVWVWRPHVQKYHFNFRYCLKRDIITALMCHLGLVFFTQNVTDWTAFSEL